MLGPVTSVPAPLKVNQSAEVSCQGGEERSGCCKCCSQRAGPLSAWLTRNNSLIWSLRIYSLLTLNTWEPLTSLAAFNILFNYPCWEWQGGGRQEDQSDKIMWFSLIRRELSSPVLRNTFNRSTFQQHSPNTSFSFNQWNYLVFNEPMKMKIESWILHIRTILCRGSSSWWYSRVMSVGVLVVLVERLCDSPVLERRL